MNESPFNVVKAQLPITRAIQYATGQEPAVVTRGTKHLIRCPFDDHFDKEPSCQLDGNKFTCWSHPGGKLSGSVIDFLMRYSNEDKKASAQRAYSWLGLEWPQNGDGKKSAKHQPNPTTKAAPADKKAKDNWTYADRAAQPADKEGLDCEKATCAAFYEYKTPKGKPHMMVFRHYDSKGNRWFVQWTWNGKYYVSGCPEDTSKYLYGIDTINTSPPNVIYLVEGEKDVDNLAKLGLMATTWPMGAASLKPFCEKWDILSPLKGWDVYFIPDNDDGGELAFNDSLQFLFGRVDNLFKVKLPGLPHKGDASDFLEINKDQPNLKELFLEHVHRSEIFVPKPETPNLIGSAKTWISIAKSRPPRIDIVQGLIPKGLTLIGGKKSARKSTLCQNIALSVAQGVKALGYFETTQGTALHGSFEDDDRSWAERLEKMLTNEHGGVDRPPEKLFFVPRLDPLGRGLEKRIESFKNDYPDLNLVFLDIFTKILGDKRKILKGSQSGGYHEIYDIVTPLRDLALKLEIAIVLTHHLKKSESEDEFDDFLGTSGLADAADNIIIIKRAIGQKYDNRLSFRGRFVYNEKPLALRFNAPMWTLSVIGEIGDLQLSQTEQAVIDFLVSNNKPTKLDELSEHCGAEKNNKAFLQTVLRLTKKGLITKCLQKGYYQATPSQALQDGM